LEDWRWVDYFAMLAMKAPPEPSFVVMRAGCDKTMKHALNKLSFECKTLFGVSKTLLHRHKSLSKICRQLQNTCNAISRVSGARQSLPQFFYNISNIYKTISRFFGGLTHMYKQLSKINRSVFNTCLNLYHITGLRGGFFDRRRFVVCYCTRENDEVGKK
jgi:hypothetical protein